MDKLDIVAFPKADHLSRQLPRLLAKVSGREELIALGVSVFHRWRGEGTGLDDMNGQPCPEKDCPHPRPFTRANCWFSGKKCQLARASARTDGRPGQYECYRPRGGPASTPSPERRAPRGGVFNHIPNAPDCLEHARPVTRTAGTIYGQPEPLGHPQRIRSRDGQDVSEPARSKGHLDRIVTSRLPPAFDTSSRRAPPYCRVRAFRARQRPALRTSDGFLPRTPDLPPGVRDRSFHQPSC